MRSLGVDMTPWPLSTPITPSGCSALALASDGTTTRFLSAKAPSGQTRSKSPTWTLLEVSPMSKLPTSVADGAKRPSYREHLRDERLDPGELRGKDLVCTCKLTDPCHADVLLELANPE